MLRTPNTVLLIGLGRQGKRHLDRLRMQGIEPICYDSRVESYPGADAAIVATPPATQFEVVQKLLAAGIPTLVEKPLALSGKEARALQKLAQEKNTLLAVGHSERFNPAFLDVQKRSAEVPLQVTTQRFGPGGDFFDLAVHDVELLLRLGWWGKVDCRVEGGDTSKKVRQWKLVFPKSVEIINFLNVSPYDAILCEQKEFFRGGPFDIETAVQAVEELEKIFLYSSLKPTSKGSYAQTV
jgi:hypothetical protein